VTRPMARSRVRSRIPGPYDRRRVGRSSDQAAENRPHPTRGRSPPTTTQTLAIKWRALPTHLEGVSTTSGGRMFLALAVTLATKRPALLPHSGCGRVLSEQGIVSHPGNGRSSCRVWGDLGGLRLLGA
jgi:hypothetical protein